jgi:hypothetical protein
MQLMKVALILVFVLCLCGVCITIGRNTLSVSENRIMDFLALRLKGGEEIA